MKRIEEEELLTELERIYKVNNVNPMMLDNPKLAKFVDSERQKEDAWNDLGGCRQGRHVMREQSFFQKTGGLENWMTQSGFILSLSENLHRETPTEVLMLLGSVLLSSDAHKEYTKRIMGIGYDMMCVLYKRLRTLIDGDYLPQEQISLFISFLHYLFVDAFHVESHTLDLCQKINGLFHPRSKKFTEQRTGTSNASIVEQNWKIINGLTYAKNLGERRFEFMLYEFKKRHNNKNWNRLLKHGYEFIKIKNTAAIRELSGTQNVLPSTHELRTDPKYKTLRKVKLIIASQKRTQAEANVFQEERLIKRKRLQI